MRHSTLARLVRIGLTVACATAATPVSALTEIPLRDASDGAGPSHIFHLNDDLIAVVDQLDRKIVAYRVGEAAAKRKTELPAGTRPWRLVRQAERIIIISEGGTHKLEVPRDINQWPAKLTELTLSSTDPLLRVTPLERNARGFLVVPRRNGRPALALPAGPFYQASARELETSSDGSRHVLWKETRFDKADAKTRRLQVDVYVGKFDPAGKLTAVARVPRARMSRIGFDYLTILPNGTALLLASLDRQRFKIMALPFGVPRPRAAADNAVLEPVIDPEEFNVLNVGTNTPKPSSPVPIPQGWVARADVRTAMSDYRTKVWTLTEQNRRDPCTAIIVQGQPSTCGDEPRYVIPTRHLSQPVPVDLPGLPYDWGGFDSLDEFQTKLDSGRYVAGNIGDYFWPDNAPQVTAGVDCSGVVSRVWGLRKHVATGDLDTVMVPLAKMNNLFEGDALLLPKHHVVLFQQHLSLDGASAMIKVTEASSRCSSVCESIYELDQFHDYQLRRYRRIVGR